MSQQLAPKHLSQPKFPVENFQSLQPKENILNRAKKSQSISNEFWVNGFLVQWFRVSIKPSAKKQKTQGFNIKQLNSSINQSVPIAFGPSYNFIGSILNPDYNFMGLWTERRIEL